jgi:hypothetical protein
MQNVALYPRGFKPAHLLLVLLSSLLHFTIVIYIWFSVFFIGLYFMQKNFIKKLFLLHES